MMDIPHGLIKGEVIHRIDWTDNEFSLRVKADICPYVAGQFTKLALQNDMGEWPRRAYSFVNSPNHSAGHQQMEFLLITVPDGKLSPRLNALNVGDDVYVGNTPAGFMTLDEIPDNMNDLWLLSTGTAIGPFLALLDEAETQQRFQQLVLVHAVRRAEELVYQDKIRQLIAQYQGRLHYVPIVSREPNSTTLCGRIPQLLQTGELVSAAGVPLTADHSFFYLCGNPDMVKDTSVILKHLGYQKHLRQSAGHFNSENYW